MRVRSLYDIERSGDFGMSQINQSRKDAFGVFWAALEPRQHLVQVYEDEGTFLDSLEGFVMTGLKAGEAVILIAIPEHLKSLEERIFESQGIDLRSKAFKGRYFWLDADETLAKFLVDGKPDEKRFRQLLSKLIDEAKGGGRKVRTFGEMVVLLWRSGNKEATLRLEQFWNKLCCEKDFAMFCAYPKNNLIRETGSSIRMVCATHSKVVAV